MVVSYFSQFSCNLIFPNKVSKMKLAAFLFGTVPLIIQFYAKKYAEDDLTETLNELEQDFGMPRIKTYDFIVVGGGTAGSIVAGRLSENFNVLLLESGGNFVPQAHVPFFSYDVALDPDINYVYRSLPQQNMSLANGGIVKLETGKMLGGSGSHNEMIHQRGNPLDWDGYAAMLGDASWRYENVLQFFKKSEDFVGELLQPDQADYYGQGGPLTLETHMAAIFPFWEAAGLELGYPIADPNALQIPSFAPFQKLIDRGGRVSTYNRYVQPFEATRSNLTVIRYSTVLQVLLNKDNNRAYGVTYLRHGIPQIAHASKEIILSGGAVHSPLIMMMSGIGDRSRLEEAGIPVRVHLPSVGQNMNDHIYIPIPDIRFNASAAPYLPRIREEDLEATLSTYLETGGGEFGKLQEGAQAFFVSSRAIADGQTTWPDGRITLDTMSPMPLSDDEDSKSCFHIELDRMRSVGSVTLNVSAYLSGSTDFVQLAEIDFKGFSDPSDMEVALESIELIFNILEGTESFRSLGAEYVGTPVNGCTHLPFRSREYWVCYVQQIATTGIHMVGTSGMGAVTDSKMRVMGVPGLRVVDAGVLPVTPNANLNAPIVLVGEKGAADIAADWGVV